MWLGLVDIFHFWNVYRTVRKKDFVFLARVRVSSQYFPILDCISFSFARKRSWLSLWLGLVVDISQFWNVDRIVCKNDFVFLAGVSSQYFPVLRSASEELFSVPFSQTVRHGDRRFSVAVATLWNQLPNSVRMIETL